MSYRNGDETRANEVSSNDDESATEQDSQGTEAMSMEWTDQKHSLYLKSMEASFVNQLRTSKDIFGQRSQNMIDSKVSGEVENCTTSGEFKILRRGCWKRLNFQKPEPCGYVESEYHGLLTNPWIRHLQSGKESMVVPAAAFHGTSASQRLANNLGAEKTLSRRSAATTKASRPYPLFSFQNHLVDEKGGKSQRDDNVLAEGSDQNFVEEDIEHEVDIDNSSSKRIKTLKASDHVVPCDEYEIPEDVSENIGIKTTPASPDNVLFLIRETMEGSELHQCSFASKRSGE